MALIHWQPFREMNSLQRDMNRLFEALAPMEQESMQQSFMPLAEMEETDDSIHLRVEIPGMDASNLDVQVTKEAVLISGERQSQSKSEKNGMTRSEFRYGKFSRMIPLSTRIDNNSVKGDYNNGILTLELPKAKEDANQVTRVNLGSSNNTNSQSVSGSQPQPLNTADTNTNQDNKPEGGYGNTPDVWNEDENKSSQSETVAS
ncbi:MAG TPA: Hsp20/alpha crystallin family protein [Coleofasciculaceae cyanobacterium]|jgi:HSP20 family protein